MATNDNDIHIGVYEENPHLHWQTKFICDSQLLAHHIDKPWFQAWVADRVGMPVGDCHDQLREPAIIADELMGSHTFIMAATGAGKTKGIEHIVGEILKRNRSVVELEPKLATIHTHIALAHELGIPPERVKVFSPRLEGASGGFNPFAAGLPPAQICADFATLLNTEASFGPRMFDVIANLVALIATHGLSLFELFYALVDEQYLVSLLQKAPAARGGADKESYIQIRQFFEREFLIWSRSERVQAVAPVLRRLRELLRNPFLRDLLTARTNALDMPSLWQTPQLVLVHLDFPTLGTHATELLAGLFASSLYRRALQTSGPVPVSLVLDEAAIADRFMGRTLVEILQIARSSNLSLILATQYAASLSDELRAAVLSQCAVQLYLRLGATDARSVASALAVGTRSRIQRVAVNLKDNSEYAPRAYWRTVLYDTTGKTVRCRPTEWKKLFWDSYFAPSPARYLCETAARGTRLYVKCPVTDRPIALEQYLDGISPAEYWLEGPDPLAVVVSFPKPQLAGVERWGEQDAARAWEQVLVDLPIRHSVLRLAGQPARPVKVVGVPNRELTPSFWKYQSEIARLSGQTTEQNEETLQWRREQIAQTTGVDVGPGKDGNDESIP